MKKNFQSVILLLMLATTCNLCGGDLKDQRGYWIRLDRFDDSTALIDGVKFDEKQLRIVCELLRGSGREPSFVVHYEKDPGELESWLKKMSSACSVQHTSLVGSKSATAP